MTNDRDALMNCIDTREFDLSNDYDGSICVNVCCFGTFNPYSEICKSAKQNITSQSKRKVAGIVIIQSSKALYHFPSQKEEIEQSVRSCGVENIQLITIGIRNADANHEELIKLNEVKAFSTNKQDSVVCDYNTMLYHLKKIAQVIGGPIDYWLEATHTPDCEECVNFLREGYSKGDALCANEYGKLCYYGIYVLKIRQKNFLVKKEGVEDWQSARKYFETAAKNGVAEAKNFIQKETIPKDYVCKFMGILISDIEIFDEQTKESIEKEIEDPHESKAMSVISMIMGIIFLFSNVSLILLVLAVLGVTLGNDT